MPALHDGRATGGGAMSQTGDLFGPDASDAPREEVVIEVENPIDVAAWQFCNRWVFLEHQRPHALKELRVLLADAVIAFLQRQER